jgi:hypothetical protein
VAHRGSDRPAAGRLAPAKGTRPLTPTLPGPGEASDQAKEDIRSGVVGVVWRVTVVTVVGRFVVSAAPPAVPSAALAGAAVDLASYGVHADPFNVMT